MAEYFDDRYSNLAQEVFWSFDANGYGDYLMRMRDHIANNAKVHDCGYTQVSVPDWVFPAENTPVQDRDAIQIFWSLLVNLYGCCGVTDRTGWIEQPEKALDFLDYGIFIARVDCDDSEAIIEKMVSDPEWSDHNLDDFDTWKAWRDAHQAR